MLHTHARSVWRASPEARRPDRLAQRAGSEVALETTYWGGEKGATTSSGIFLLSIDKICHSSNSDASN